jgi:hypothetical protein
MLPFGVTIPATVPQGSEIPEGLMNNPVLFLEIKNIEGAFIASFPRQSYAYAYREPSHHEYGGKNLLWIHFPTITSTAATFAELHGVAVRNEVNVSFRNVKSQRLRTYFINISFRECSKTCCYCCWCCCCTA